MGPPPASSVRWLACVVLGLGLVAGCAGRRPAVLQPLQRLEPKPVVVLIPGITGTRLRDRESGRLLWGSSRAFFTPRDGGYSAARPLSPETHDRVEISTPVTRIRLFGLIPLDVYGSLLRLLERHGYRRGELGAPAAGEDLFVFAYDWRRSHVEAAAALAAALERVRRARGAAQLRVNFICHSNAATIARYYVKYGAASLEQAEAGIRDLPPGIRVDKLIMVATANGGAMGTLRELNRGRTYLPWLGRRFRPETFFTFPALFEALPAPGDHRFLAPTGEPLEVDLYDPEDWRIYSWSIYDRSVQRRLARAGRADLFADAARRAAHLDRSLDRARRLHAVLERDVSRPPETRYYSLQSAYRPTPARAVLERDKGHWRTWFSDDRRVKRDPYLHARASAPGDGHAALDSQDRLSPRERQALARPTVHVRAAHRGLIGHPAVQRQILEFLLE